MNQTGNLGKVNSTNVLSSPKQKQERPQSSILLKKQTNLQENNQTKTTAKVKPQVQLNDKIFSYYSNALAKKIHNQGLNSPLQQLRPQSAQIVQQKLKSPSINLIKEKIVNQNTKQQQLKTSQQPFLSQPIKPQPTQPSNTLAISQPKLINPPKSMTLSTISFKKPTLSNAQNNNSMVKLNSSIQFADDEHIDIKSLIQDYNPKSYNLDTGLSFQVTSIHNYFKFNSEKSQTIPIMVSVKTLEDTQDLGKDKKQQQKGQHLGTNNSVKSQNLENITQSRPSIDLICVMDISGSMKGQKLNNLKDTLLVLIDLLGENDRLCLITFNHKAERLTNLQRITYQNRHNLKKIIQSLTADGHTDITAGLQTALQVIENRRIKNLVTSIFLLSDGQDKVAELGVSLQMKALATKEQYSLHSFGFGSDHDAKMMNNICELKGGNFYYVEKIDQIDEFFVDALGGLFSVVAQEVEIEVKLNLQDPQVNSLFKHVQISKTYGPMWTVVQQGLSYKIKISQLFSGVSKDFVFELMIPPKVVAQLNDSERNAEIITASLVATPVCIVSSTKVARDAKLTLTLFSNNEIVTADSEINDTVEFNYLRVQASEAISQAIEKADSRQFSSSQNILSNMVDLLRFSSPQTQQKVQSIKSDLLEFKANSAPQSYSQTTNQRMFATMTSNLKQSSVLSNNQNVFSNQRQLKMVQLLRSIKNNDQEKDQV